MTDPVKEQLSACLDGELPEGELDLMLKQVSRDPQLRAALGRYALIGEAMRAKSPMAAPAGFASRVAAAVATEPSGEISPAPQAKPGRDHALGRWLRPVAGLAVAAGVAAVAILSLQQPQQVAPQPYIADATLQPPAPSSPDQASYIVPASTTDSSAFVPAARLTNYVVAHSEYSSPLGRRSVLSGVLAEEDTGDMTDVDEATDASESATEVTQP